MIAYYTPDFYNIGDKIIYFGIRGKRRGKLLFNSELNTYDKLIICGTPWLFDQCFQSEKYQSLLETIKNHKGPKIARAIGSCYPYDWLDQKELTLQHEEENEYIKEFWEKFDHITVRDKLAEYVLNELGVNCTLEKCPSYHVVDLFGIKAKEPEYNLLVIQDPEKSISGNALPSFDWHDLYKRVYDEYNPLKVIAISEDDANYAKDMGISAELIYEENPYNETETSVKNLLEIIARANVVISARVHSAIPALSLGKETYILPLDSRYLTAELVGVKKYGNIPKEYTTENDKD